MKYLIIILIVLGLLAIVYYTFIEAVIEMLIGIIFLLIMLLALAGIYIAWKRGD